MDKAVESVKARYAKLMEDRLRNGKLPLKDTGIGFWSISSQDDIYAMCTALNIEKYKHVVDLGSGDGRVTAIMSLFAKTTGIEYDEELHNMAQRMNEKANLIKGDYLCHDISAYDMVFLHPDQTSQRLQKKLKDELKGDLVVYGAEFHPKGLTKIRQFKAGTTPVTVYR